MRKELVTCKKWYKEQEQEILDRWFALLSIPSVSADTAKKGEVLRAAEFIESELKNIGLEVERIETEGNPVILGSRIVDENAPTVLIYGHYDVQPEDPIDEWDSAPFEPTLKDGYVYARGASDNKGQIFHAMVAIHAFIEMQPDAKVNIKCIIEGEEEIGSPSIEKVLQEHKEKFKADYVLINDMGFEKFSEPSLMLGVRGIVDFEISVKNQDIDCHSGGYGGGVYNPIRALTEVLGSVIDQNGTIKIDGFYDQVKPLSENAKKNLAINKTAQSIQEEIGCKAFHHEVGYSIGESITIRPTFEINGIFGGYQGTGTKTVIPKRAGAKVTCRLVPEQDPEHIKAVVTKYLQEAFPKGFTVDIESHGSGMAAWTSSQTYVANTMKQAMEDVLGKKCLFGMTGGSIPISKMLQEASDGEFIFTGVGFPDDHIHAPNERYSLEQFEKGFEIIYRALELFAQK